MRRVDLSGCARSCRAGPVGYGVGGADDHAESEGRADPGLPAYGQHPRCGCCVCDRIHDFGDRIRWLPAAAHGVDLYAPAGAKLNGKGFATCAPSVIQEKGPSACSKKSTAGPKGSASGVVSFGTERVQETVSVQPFFAPGGGLEFFVDGVSPVSIEILSKGSITGAAPPFGQEFIAEVPLIESVPGALDASAKEINVTVGAASKQGKKTSYYLVIPKKCPPGGFPRKAVMSFLGGTTAEAS